jgi:hypothetical protein
MKVKCPSCSAEQDLGPFCDNLKDRRYLVVCPMNYLDRCNFAISLGSGKRRLVVNCLRNVRVPIRSVHFER